MKCNFIFFSDIALVRAAETEDAPKVLDEDLGISREGSRTGKFYNYFFS